jgi:hypothetical protein
VLSIPVTLVSGIQAGIKVERSYPKNATYFGPNMVVITRAEALHEFDLHIAERVGIYVTIAIVLSLLFRAWSVYLEKPKAGLPLPPT